MRKIWFFLHTSVVPSSPEWHRQEIGMTASCLGRLWRQPARYSVAAEQCSCAFTGFFVMCDLQLPQRCFICDLVFPAQMAISCLTRPLHSCRTASGKIKVTLPGAGAISGLYLMAHLLHVRLNGDLTPFSHHIHSWSVVESTILGWHSIILLKVCLYFVGNSLSYALNPSDSLWRPPKLPPKTHVPPKSRHFVWPLTSPLHRPFASASPRPHCKVSYPITSKPKDVCLQGRVAACVSG